MEKSGSALLDGIGIWIGFSLLVAVLLFLDFVILSRRQREIRIKEALWLTVFWKLVAGIVGLWIFTYGNTSQGLEYTTAYIAELALSIDNLFVFIIIFAYFKLPRAYQPRALLFGIIGALMARAVFIGVGVAVISAFEWILYVLGIFLIYTGYKLVAAGDQEMDPERNIALRILRRIIPISNDFDGTKLFTRLSTGKIAATPFLLVLLVLATTDLVFAVDSIPTVFGISDDPFIVWSSNTMAVLGLRPLYFLIEGLANMFRFLKYGLAIILGFIGLKMITETAFHGKHLVSENIDIFLALAVILTVLFSSILLSWLIPEKTAKQQ